MTGCSDNDAQWPIEIYAMNMQYTACDAYIYITLLLHMRIFVFALLHSYNTMFTTNLGKTSWYKSTKYYVCQCVKDAVFCQNENIELLCIQYMCIVHILLVMVITSEIIMAMIVAKIDRTSSYTIIAICVYLYVTRPWI